MIALIFGLLIGFLTRKHKFGLPLLLVPSVLASIAVANASYQDFAGVFITVWSLIGYLVAYGIKKFRSRKKIEPLNE